MMADKSILYDPTKCTACRGCQAACKNWNENDEFIPDWENGVKASNSGSYENPPDLSPSTWLKIEFREVETGGELRWLFTRRACMHCTDAGCVRVCPTGALYHDDNGFVGYNKDLCSGCGYCVDSCPFQVPRSTRNILTGVAVMDKCTLCTTQSLNRIAEGYEPACVKTCPTNALIYGDRSELLADGKMRVSALRDNGWYSANLYGETELGGLHVMYVLPDSPTVYGLPVDPKVSGTTVAWQNVLQPAGLALGGVTILGLGLNYLVARANTKKEK
ncbi:4Fe-4S dicluster domain-containing protein [Chloroflexota bacterium]